MRSRGDVGRLLIGSAALTAFALTVHPATALPDPDGTGREIYESTCAACHGLDGTGAPRTQVGFEDPLPDFTDCSFASREPDADWVGVAAEGGPTRGFAHTMPAFGEALTEEELHAAVGYIRSFCREDGWPRGELNLPRAMYTEKAYPEDEAVWTVISPLEGPAGFENEIIYEKRFGARSMWELVVPFTSYERSADEGGGWTGGFGDIALGVKHTLLHSLESGSILSLGGEVIVPTGDEGDGLSSRVTILEPFAAFGQLFPGETFVQIQAGGEFPTDTDIAGNEAFWRAAVGKSFVSGRYGRVWSPMIEVLGARELESGAETEWDLAPQLHVTINTRQHVQGNIAVRLPLTDTDTRDPQLAVFVLWDWFDGGLFEGW
jgi:mono/diheme cytochrome c family protein